MSNENKTFILKRQAGHGFTQIILWRYPKRKRKLVHIRDGNKRFVMDKGNGIEWHEAFNNLKLGDRIQITFLGAEPMTMTEHIRSGRID